MADSLPSSYEKQLKQYKRLVADKKQWGFERFNKRTWGISTGTEAPFSSRRPADANRQQPPPSAAAAAAADPDTSNPAPAPHACSPHEHASPIAPNVMRVRSSSNRCWWSRGGEECEHELAGDGGGGRWRWWAVVRKTRRAGARFWRKSTMGIFCSLMDTVHRGKCALNRSCAV
jgi:hypothetical protein